MKGVSFRALPMTVTEVSLGILSWKLEQGGMWRRCNGGCSSDHSKCHKKYIHHRVFHIAKDDFVKIFTLKQHFWVALFLRTPSCCFVLWSWNMEHNSCVQQISCSLEVMLSLVWNVRNCNHSLHKCVRHSVVVLQSMCARVGLDGAGAEGWHDLFCTAKPIGTEAVSGRD